MPDGLELRPVRPEHWRPIWEADIEAFSDDWDPDDASETGFQRFLGEPDQVPALWQVAWDGDQVAGHVLVTINRGGRAASGVGEGVLDSVAVRRAWRRRGLARALIVRALVALRDHGETSARRSASTSTTPTRPSTSTRRAASSSTLSGAVYEKRIDPTRDRADRAGSVRRTGDPLGRRGRATVARARWSSWRRGPARPGGVGSRRARRASDSTIAASEPPVEVGPAPGAGEERVAAEQHARLSREQADRALRVAGGVQDLEVDVAEADRDRPRPARRPARWAGWRTGRWSTVGCSSPWRSSAWTAIVAPVASTDRRVVADVVPMAMGRDDELERPAPLGQRAPVSQATEGVAVSMAIASRLASSPRTQTLVATGPTTRWRISIAGQSRRARAGSGTGCHRRSRGGRRSPSTRMLARASR